MRLSTCDGVIKLDLEADRCRPPRDPPPGDPLGVASRESNTPREENLLPILEEPRERESLRDLPRNVSVDESGNTWGLLNKSNEQDIVPFA